jgi:hypothetical protein
MLFSTQVKLFCIQHFDCFGTNCISYCSFIIFYFILEIILGGRAEALRVKALIKGKVVEPGWTECSMPVSFLYQTSSRFFSGFLHIRTSFQVSSGTYLYL